MKPFKKGFVTKCAEYGIAKDDAKDIFDKIASAIDMGTILGPIGLGAGAGLYNYVNNRDVPRSLLAGLGTAAGSGLGGLAGGAAGLYAGLRNTSREDLIKAVNSANTEQDALYKLYALAKPGLLGTALGGLGGAGIGGFAGYQAGDWLGRPNKKETT